ADFLAHHELPLPPLDEQRRIVERIKQCMDRIDELHELRAQSKAMAVSLLPAYLNEASKTAKGTSALLGDVLQDTQNGRSIRTDRHAGNGSVLTLSAVRSISLDMSARKAVSFEEAVAQKYQIRSGDVVISRSNTRELVGLS